jgi:hypothetical protein
VEPYRQVSDLRTTRPGDVASCALIERSTVDFSQRDLTLERGWGEVERAMNGLAVEGAQFEAFISKYYMSRYWDRRECWTLLRQSRC